MLNFVLGFLAGLLNALILILLNKKFEKNIRYTITKAENEIFPERAEIIDTRNPLDEFMKNHG